MGVEYDPLRTKYDSLGVEYDLLRITYVPQHNKYDSEAESAGLRFPGFGHLRSFKFGKYFVPNRKCLG